jgi:hypothetical protein
VPLSPRQGFKQVLEGPGGLLFPPLPLRHIRAWVGADGRNWNLALLCDSGQVSAFVWALVATLSLFSGNIGMILKTRRSASDPSELPPCSPLRWPPHCSLNTPRTFRPQDLCTCRAICQALFYASWLKRQQRSLESAQSSPVLLFFFFFFYGSTGV